MSFKYESIPLSSHTCKYYIKQNEYSLSFKDWLNHIQESDSFILNFNQVLINSNFSAFFWEVKPVTTKTLDDLFEFVLVKSNSFQNVNPDRISFRDYFDLKKIVVHFKNLGGDAELIVPCPADNHTKYAHLADFVRTASEKQIIAFWKKVGEVYADSIGDISKWLSTSGLGVYWVHVRVDSRPKYYQFLEYKQF